MPTRLRFLYSASHSFCSHSGDTRSTGSSRDAPTSGGHRCRSRPRSPEPRPRGDLRARQPLDVLWSRTVEGRRPGRSTARGANEITVRFNTGIGVRAERVPTLLLCRAFGVGLALLFVSRPDGSA